MEELAYVLEGCGIDYEKLYARLSFEKPGVSSYWTYLNYVVNVAMALKSRAEMSLLTGEEPDVFALDFYGKLTEKHGMAIGHFTGDECLSGTSPVQGSECCSIVEAMYSYEELLSIGGNPFWGDLLEQTAFNGLAATVSADMWTHQYVQMTNQVECTRIPEGKAPFNFNGGDAHTFGLEPHFGCCTANFNQGWPKFALSSVMRTEDGLAVTAIAPVSVETEVCGKKVSSQREWGAPTHPRGMCGISGLSCRRSPPGIGRRYRSAWICWQEPMQGRITCTNPLTLRIRQRIPGRGLRGLTRCLRSF